MLLNFLSAPVYNQWHSLHVQPYISCAVGVAPQNAFISTSCRRCGSLRVYMYDIYACNFNVVRWFSYICHNRNLAIPFIAYVCTYWDLVHWLFVYILHFTLVSIVTGGYYFPWLYWQEVVGSYTTGNCKMMFPIRYLVCLLIVYYLVQQDQLDWRIYICVSLGFMVYNNHPCPRGRVVINVRLPCIIYYMCHNYYTKWGI